MATEYDSQSYAAPSYGNSVLADIFQGLNNALSTVETNQTVQAAIEAQQAVINNGGHVAYPITQAQGQSVLTSWSLTANQKIVLAVLAVIAGLMIAKRLL